MSTPNPALPADAAAVYRRYLSAVVVNGHAIAEAAGLGATDFQALNLIALAGTLSPGALARRLGLTTGATTRLIDRLEQAGHVRRVPDSSDRRRVNLELTGTPSQFDAVLAPVRRGIADLLATYTADQIATLFDYFRRAADAYEEATAALMIRQDAPRHGPASHR